MHIRPISHGGTMRRISTVCKRTRKLAEWRSEALYGKAFAATRLGDLWSMRQPHDRRLSGAESGSLSVLHLPGASRGGSDREGLLSTSLRIQPRQSNRIIISRNGYSSGARSCPQRSAGATVTLG